MNYSLYSGGAFLSRNSYKFEEISSFEGMKNFINTLFLLLLFVSLRSAAQQGILMMPLEQDSAQIELNKQIEYRQLISGQMPAGLMTEKIELPGFNFNEELARRYSLNFNLYSFGGVPTTGISTGSMYPFFSPFHQNGMVFSEGAYKFGDKFTLGGFSYGANSMMSALLPNQGLNKFNTYGSTLFMQYKVSKNFKIETRVNVSQGGKYPGF